MTLVHENGTELEGGIKVTCLWSDDWEFSNSNGTSCVCKFMIGNLNFELESRIHNITGKYCHNTPWPPDGTNLVIVNQHEHPLSVGKVSCVILVF